MDFGFTSLGTFYPNGDSTQRIGIVPDTLSVPTRAALRIHKDVVLEKAILIAGCNESAGNVSRVEPRVSIFPNPANDIVNISLSSLSGDPVLLSVSDITGRVLRTKKVHNNAADLATSFDISALSPGIYFVKVKAGTQQYVIKFVKE